MFGATSWWLPLLGFGVSGKDKAALQGQLPPALSPGAGQQKAHSTPVSASACQASQTPSLKEPLAGFQLHEAGSVSHQVEVIRNHQVGTGSLSVPELGLRSLSRSLTV